MQRNIAITVIICVAFMALVLGLTAHRILSPSIMTQEQLSEQGLFVYELPRRIEPFSLIDHNGNAFTKEWLQGKWSLLFFGFTFCPDICPVTLSTIRQFEQVLAEADPEAAQEVQVAMVSVDPQRDTPEKLKEYMGYFSEDYVGATGEYIDIFNLARQVNVAFGYTPQEDGEYLVNHSAQIILVNPQGDFHGFFKTPHEPEQMVSTFRSVYESWNR